LLKLLKYIQEQQLTDGMGLFSSGSEADEAAKLLGDKGKRGLGSSDYGSYTSGRCGIWFWNVAQFLVPLVLLIFTLTD
jgi:hypothetical protein